MALAIGSLAGCSAPPGAEAEAATPPQTLLASRALAKPYRSIGSIESVDPAFAELVAPDARIEVLAEGFEWTEGPVWDPKARHVLFSDIPRNSVLAWSENSAGGALALFLQPAGYTGEAPRGGESGSNGLALDEAGRLILCQHGDRRVARHEGQGRFSSLAERFQGKRLNSPNDLAIHPSGVIFFTDPPYGLEKGMEDPAKELDFQGVYKIATDGTLTLVTRELSRPNGIALSPDGKLLYVANSDDARPIWMVFDVAEDGATANGRVFFDASPWIAQGAGGVPDGLKVDARGNLFATGPGGVVVLSPDGRHLGTIHTGQATANCAFGEDGSTLFICADMFLCRVRTKTKGQGF